MQKKLTITLDERVYEGLYAVIVPRNISEFIERLVRPYVLNPDLEAGYCAMAEDEAYEAEALAWAEATGGDTVGQLSKADLQQVAQAIKVQLDII